MLDLVNDTADKIDGCSDYKVDINRQGYLYVIRKGKQITGMLITFKLLGDQTYMNMILDKYQDHVLSLDKELT